MTLDLCVDVQNEAGEEVGEQHTTVSNSLKGSLVEKPGTEYSPHHQVSALQGCCQHGH